MLADVPAKSTRMPSSVMVTAAQFQRRVVAVHRHVIAPGARGPLAQGLAHGQPRTLDDVVALRLQVGQLELAQQALQPHGAHRVAGDQRMEVALDLAGLAHVGAHDVQHGFLDHALACEAQRRQEQSFVKDFQRIGSGVDAADVDHVHRRCEERHSLLRVVFAVEHRRDHDHVEQVAGALPRIVGDEHVAVAHGVDGKGAQEVQHRISHRIDVARRAGHGLRDHAPVGQEHAGRQVAGLARGGAECGANQCLRLFLDNGEQSAPDQLLAQLLACG